MTPQDTKFKITGGRPLTGTIIPQGNKNEALPVLAAACLASGPVTLENMPAIDDADTMQQILTELGVSLQAAGQGSIRLSVSGGLKTDLPVDLSARLRGSVTLAGPLLARCGRVLLPRPGGDRIGRRRLDTHFLAFQALGATIEEKREGYLITAKQLTGADIMLDEASVTATENAVCAAVLAEGETTLRNAASEPHVQGLCRMLNGLGAHIEGVGTNQLRIRGVKQLNGGKHRIGPDFQEIGSFIALAAVTGGALRIKDAGVADLRMIRHMFSRLGVKTDVEGDDLLVPARQELRIVADWGGAVPKIDDAPWPGFPADLTSVALVTATQCHGTVLIHEKLYESRLFFTDSLISMGARIILCDPHRAVVIGPDRLRGARLSSPDIRAGMAMLIAALCAEGESLIQNVAQIDRGFAAVDTRLRQLGADIERVK